MKTLKRVILLLLFAASSVSASSFLGGVGALGSSTFLLQTADPNLPNAQAMGALGTGLVFNTTTTGVQSIYTTSGTGTVVCLTTSCGMTTPTFATSLTGPLLIGGSGTTQTLTYKTTTGVGTTGADHIFQVGNNGATEALRILNNGKVGIGTAAPVQKFVVSSAGAVGLEVSPGLNMAGGAAPDTTLLLIYDRVGVAYDVMDLSAGSYRFGIQTTPKVTINTSGDLAALSTTASTSTTTGSLVNAGGFGNAGAIYTATLNIGTNLAIRDTSAAFDVTIVATDPATISAGRTLTLGMGNVAHTLNFGTTANTITFPNVASGTVAMLNAANAFSSGSNTFTAINNVFGSTLAINGNGGSTTGIASTTMATGGTALTPTSGATRLVDFGSVFSPTSGSATFVTLNVTTTINQTGGANGITRALYINPTVTAAADFRALETVTGSIFLGGLSTGTNADTVCLASTGQVLIQAAACTISKRHLKEHFAPIHDALAMVMALNPQEFSMKPTVPANGDINFLRPQFGFIAEDVYAVDARLSVVDPDGLTPKTWRTEAMVAVLVGAMQELTQEVEKLKHHAVH